MPINPLKGSTPWTPPASQEMRIPVQQQTNDQGSAGTQAVSRQYINPGSSNSRRRFLLKNPGFESSNVNANNSADSEQKKRHVRHAYEDLRLFHGTNKIGLDSIRTNGMSTRLKVEGGTDANFKEAEEDTEIKQQARKYNYLTNNKGMARFFANSATSDPLKEFSRKNGDAGTPKLVRLFQTPDFPKIESDPDFSEFFEAEAYRTPNDISQNLIRQGKDANRYSEEILTALKKHVENKFNASLNIDEIERALLDGAESDSDDDFR